MRLYYSGVDITDRINIKSAVHRDVSDGRFDSLSLTFENSALWQRWKPQMDDEIELVHNGYTTGKLYLSAIAPEGDLYRAIATSGKLSARRVETMSYTGYKLGTLMEVMAQKCGMTGKLFGIDEKYTYAYLAQNHESAAHFMSRLLHMEGGVLKTVSGRLAGIGINYAQDRECLQNMRIDADMNGVKYTSLPHKKIKSIVMVSPYFRASATDTSVENGETMTICDIQTDDIATAGRWARGLLLHHNRKAEVMTIDSELNVGMTAMTRIDVASEGDVNGEWLVDEVMHDFVNGSTSTKCLRCIRTVR